MKTDSNPYSAPAANETGSLESPRAESSVEFGSVIKTWERLRIGYNVVMAVFTILLTTGFYPENLSDLLFWFAIGLGAIIANLCFLIAPAIEGYGWYFGLWSKPLTWMLFLGGLLVTAILAWDCIANYRELLGL